MSASSNTNHNLKVTIENDLCEKINSIVAESIPYYETIVKAISENNPQDIQILWNF